MIILGERNFEYFRSSHEKINVFSSYDLNFRLDDTLKKVDKIISQTDNVYLSIDMDVLDYSVFNSVSYPLIGGIQISTLLRIVNHIINFNKTYFIDVVEYNPMLGDDNSEIFYQFIKIVCQKIGGIND